MTFSATVFVGTSLDGHIARPDDDLESTSDIGGFAQLRYTVEKSAASPGDHARSTSTTPEV
ncbi:hypothetical protein ACFY00_31170 [Kitasatospora sp. NPDC001540]|uniref:hypothetical protein n=1 Tax=Kitasatospora sp. NPDC001540 TaxID=3364014 RepID=UPI00369DA646